MKHDLLMIGSATQSMLEKLESEFTLHKVSEISDLTGYLQQHGSQITAVMTNGHDGVPDAMMANLPNLKVISCYGVGYDGIDANAVANKGIQLSHTPNVLNNDVANTALMLMLATSRQLLRDDAWVRSGKWSELGSAPLTRSIEGAKVGILGLGRIGETIAEKLQAFNCEVSYHCRTERPNLPYQYVENLLQMATAVDYLIVIIPGGAATRKLVNEEVLNALGADGTLINVARGSVIDETALIAALQKGRLGAAGLDVFEDEPNVPESLCALENVVLLPHVGSATVETRKAMGDLTVENLSSFFSNGNVKTPVPECAHLIT